MQITMSSQGSIQNQFHAIDADFGFALKKKKCILSP